MLDILIQNAQVVDGSGNPGYKSDIGIKDNKIKISTSFVVGLSTANFYDLVDLQTRTVEIEKFDENFIKKFSISGN